jgi:signal transduction histidine kinase
MPYNLSDAFDQLPLGVAIFEASGAYVCLRHNQRFLHMVGAPWALHGSAVGEPLRAILSPDSYAETLAIFNQVRATGIPFASDDYTAVMEGDAHPRVYQWSLTPLASPDGTISALLASGIEITERKAFEAEARAAARRANDERALLDTLISTAPVGVAFLDRELRYIRINERLAQLNGLPVAAHLGRCIYDVVPELARIVGPIARQVLEAGQPILNIEAALPPGSAERGVWKRSFYPVSDATDAIIGLGIIVTEITEERQMQAALQASTLRERERAADLEALLSAVPAAVWIAHDPACRVITGSRASSRILRMPPESNLSKSAIDNGPSHFRVMREGVELRADELPVQLAARGIEVQDFEEQVVFEDGSAITLLGNATPLRDERGEVRGAVAAFLDITDRKQAEQERTRLLAAEQQARAEAEAALRIRDTFFSMAAHELKTPLTTLLGQVQLIERRARQSGALSERDQRSVQAIISQASRLNKMISAMLDLTRIERGYLSLERERVDIADLAHRIVDEIQPAHPRHQFHWSGPAAPLILSGDGMRLEQVIYNLVENAVKYSPQGGAVSVDVVEREGMAQISVCDEGIGIAASEIPRLFERFYRVQQAVERHIGGMGIGLYIVQEIVALHGGSVAVTSIEGEGSCFVVALPLTQGQ